MSNQQLTIGQQITKFIFKIDGCLSVSERADSIENAKIRVERMWPRSTVEYIKEEFSHLVEGSVLSRTPPTTTARKPKSAYSTRRPMAAQPESNLSVEDRMEKTIAENFGGVS